MKSFLLIVIGFTIGYFIKSNGTVSQVTYSDKGNKTVITSCDKDQQCMINIGQQCEDRGYKIIKIDHDDMKTIISAECGLENKFKLF